VFPNLNELPWSSCLLHSARDKTSLDPTIQKFLSVFGIHILELELDQGNYQILPDLLLSTPNLKHLDIIMGSGFTFAETEAAELNSGKLIPVSSAEPNSAYGHLNLRQPRSLKMDVDRESVDFLHYVLTSSGSRLEFLRFEVLGNGVEGTLRVASLIADADIPYVSLVLTLFLSEHHVFTTLVQQKILIRKLHVHMDDNYEPNAGADFYDPLEKFKFLRLPREVEVQLLQYSRIWIL